MAVRGLDHVNIRTPDLDRCRAFYCGLLGFEEGYRPRFDSPGAWLYAGGEAIIHVSLAAEPMTGESAIDHVAFASEGFDAMCRRLEDEGIDFTSAKVPDKPIRQIFITDPDGVVIELNFRG